MQQIPDFNWGREPAHSIEPKCTGGGGFSMPNDTEVLRRPDVADAPAARPGAPQTRAAALPATPEKAPRSSRRPWVRWALFALLPLALIAGAYWYITGGQVMSTDDAYVE